MRMSPKSGFHPRLRSSSKYLEQVPSDKQQFIKYILISFLKVLCSPEFSLLLLRFLKQLSFPKPQKENQLLIGHQIMTLNLLILFISPIKNISKHKNSLLKKHACLKAGIITGCKNNIFPTHLSPIQVFLYQTMENAVSTQS